MIILLIKCILENRSDGCRKRQREESEDVNAFLRSAYGILAKISIRQTQPIENKIHKQKVRNKKSDTNMPLLEEKYPWTRVVSSETGKQTIILLVDPRFPTIILLEGVYMRKF